MPPTVPEVSKAGPERREVGIGIGAVVHKVSCGVRNGSTDYTTLILVLPWIGVLEE